MYTYISNNVTVEEYVLFLAADYEAVNTAVGKLVASVPPCEAMSVFKRCRWFLKPCEPTDAMNRGKQSFQWSRVQ